MNAISDAVVAAFPKLSATERRVSLALYRLLAEGRPVALERLSAKADVAAGAVRDFLERWHGVKRDADGAVVGYWGLTVRETGHRMRIDGRQMYTWCAWDALFIPPLLGITATVESMCPASKGPIFLAITRSGIESVQPQATAISFVMPRSADIAQDVVKNFCRYVHFFASRALAEAWTAGQPGTLVLSLDDAWQLGLRKNAGQYGT